MSEATPKERRQIDPRLDMDRLPAHVAIIMDGNGRWAARHGKSRSEGHEAGARGVRAALEACRELGIRTLTLYAFSTENWRRSDFEVNTLFRLMSKYIHREIDEIDRNGIRVIHLGRMDGLPKKAADDLRYCIERTKGNTALDCCVAVNYGARLEIADAARAIARDAARGTLNPDDITEETVARYLYAPGHAEADVLIRTSGEMRISNFLLWQIAYAELVFTPVLWPDFGKQELCDCLVEYQARSRRFGGRP